MAYKKHNFDGNQMIYASDLQDMDQLIYEHDHFQKSNVQISKDGSTLKVFCTGLEKGATYTLKLKRRSRSNGRTGRWIGINKFGYAKLCEDQAKNPKLSEEKRKRWADTSVPNVMGTGYLPSNFEVEADTANGEIYLTLDTKTFFIPLAKPVDIEPFGDELEPDTQIALYGLNKKQQYRELHFTFWLYDANDHLIAKSNEYFGFGPFISTKGKTVGPKIVWNEELEAIELQNTRLTVY